MNLSNFFVKMRSRPMWQDPARKIRTLESFAQTEIDGGENILAAAKFVVDEKLRKHFLRHGSEELHHGELFRRRAAELRETFPSLAVQDAEQDKIYDLKQARDSNDENEVDAHGFFSAEKLESVGEIPYVAMLHIAEKKAAVLFQIHRSLLVDDPDTRAIFDEALDDERYHVAYTGAYLKQCRKRGQNSEVRDALSQAKGSRLIGAWRRIGLRSGAKFGVFVMYVLYFTLIAPFGLIARYTSEKQGWTKVVARPASQSTRSQF